MSSIDAHVGALLSKYDETAVEGITNLAAQIAADRAFADNFIAETHAVGALVSTFNRKCDMAPVFDACAQMTRAVTGPSQVALVRALVNGAPFTRMIKQLDRVRDDSAAAVVAALRLLQELFAAAPHVTFRKFQKKVPINLDVFSESHTTYALRRVREARTRVLLGFIDSSIAGSAITEIAARAVLQHGFLTKLTADAPELYASGDAQAQQLVHGVLNAITNSFVVTRAFSPARKRELLVTQRNIVKTLIKGLAIPPLAGEVATLIRKLTIEIAEPLFDYTVRRDEDDTRMPNHILFSILRKLNPRQRIVDSHLTVFILHRCPELVRPYLSRAAMHLTQVDRTISDVAANTATANVLTRIFLLPLPLHIREKLVRLRVADASATLYFDLTPTTAADEIAPKWMQEFVHKLIVKSDNVLSLVFAVQVTEAAIRRALELKAIINEMFNDMAERVINRQTQQQQHQHQFDREAFEAQFDAILRERLPQREEFWHRATQQLLPASAHESKNAEKAQFALQRLLLLMRSYTKLLSIRTSWVSAVPPITFDWAPIPVSSKSAPSSQLFRRWQPSTVAVLSALLVTGISRGVTMPKLHHITLGGGGGGAAKGEVAAEARRPPPLLELFLWFCSARNASPADSVSQLPQLSAQLWVCRLFLWVVHSVSVHYGVEIEEVHLWLSLLPASAAATLMHLLNALLQQGLSKAADRIGEQLRGATSGAIAFSAAAFVERTRTKFAEKPPSDPWQVDLAANLDVLEATAKKVAAKWDQRHAIFSAKFDLVLQRASASETAANAARTAQQQRLDRLVAQIMGGGGAAGVSGGGGGVAHVPPAELLRRFFSDKNAPKVDASAAGPSHVTRVEELLAGVETAIEGAAADRDSARLHAKIATHFTKAGELTPWMQHEPLLWKVVGLLGDTSNTVDVGQQPQWKVKLAAALVENVAASHVSLKALCTAWRGRGSSASAETALFLAILLSLHLVILGKAATSAPLDDLAALMTSEYTGTLSVRDRLLFAILAAIDSIRTPPEAPAPPRAAENIGAGAHRDDSSDESNGGESDTDDVASEAIDVSSDDGDDEDETDAMPKRRPRNDGNEDENAPQSARKSADSARPAKMWSPAVVPVWCLPSLQACRFVVGGAAIAPKITPEVDVLTQLADSWTQGDISVHALRFPTTCAPALLNSQSAGAALLPSVWRALFPDAPGATDRRICNIELLANSSPDPRYLAPLVFTVAAARSTGGSETIPASTLTAFFPFVLRGLSSSVREVRDLCKDTIALMHPVLGPIDRVIANFVRLYVAPAVPIGDVTVIRARRSRTRVPSAVTAFLVHCVHLLREDHHPLHDLAVTAFSAPPIFSEGPSVAVPLGKLLSSFPVACISAAEMAQHHHELQKQMRTADDAALAAAMGKAPPHLAFILRQLHYSCGTVSDAMRLRRCGALRTLMMLVTLLPSSTPLRFAAFSCLENVLRTSSRVMKALAGDVVPWCFAHLGQIAMDSNARHEAEYIVDILELLDSAYQQFRSTPSVHRQHLHQLATVQAAIARLRIVSAELPVVMASLHAQMTQKANVGKSAAGSGKRSRTAE